MKIITDTSSLAEACRELSEHRYCTVDTEFLRESTFWPELCLIQMASPDTAYIVDVLAPGIDLKPFFDLMAEETVVKVFHAARQDVEIIFNLGNLIPHPLFDTQIAAMVCGYGDSISYEQLVFKIIGTRIDKSSRFTDWSKRPLSQKQLDYALADVTHLRQVYQSIRANLEEQNRTHWVAEEMEVLTSPSTYDLPPEDAWQRLKMRVRKPREFAIMRNVAAWRERTARENNVPRGRVIRDDAIYEICAQPPQSMKALAGLRGIARSFDRNRYGEGLLKAVDEALSMDKQDLPKMPSRRSSPEGSGAATEMLKLLLKVTAEQNGVAPKVIATVDELEKIAADDNADVSALKGWRRELFGERALDLKHGRIAIGFSNKSIRLFDVGSEERFQTRCRIIPVTGTIQPDLEFDLGFQFPR